ncbi:MAG: DEAD/DEAH box helicase, partial [Campylobacterales bacterium]|nr:DEAD/DEAH box helicase [Campylobacterales bacterium]
MIEDKIYNLKSFQRQFEALITLSVCDTIKNIRWHTERSKLVDQIDWNNLLSIASILSYSKKSLHLDAALRIAQTCLTIHKDKDKKNAAVIILENLTNQPALKLAVDRNLISSSYNKDFPLAFKFQSSKLKIENAVFINSKLRSLNIFQKEVYVSSKQNETLSISAPTSAGKSFILYQILIDEITQRTRSTIVYIVPTRALHWFLVENPLKIDLLLVDEAQKIDDKNRGILLQQKIEEVVKLNGNIRIFFSSPFTSNPEILLENVQNSTKKDIINTQFVAVNQNLIYANQVRRKPDEWDLSLALIDKIIPLGTISLKFRPTSESKKIALISESFSESDKMNLIYSNGPADAEKYSLVLFDLLPQISQTQNIKDLINLIKKTIHPDYTLAKVLSKGVAFHYGNMPLLIRQEIENLFKAGELKYLICTSTLLEGVNL